jgi:hypothetical protein
MNKAFARFPRSLLAPVLCLLAALPIVSCSLLHRGPLSRLEPLQNGAGNLAVASRFATAADGAPGFFATLMPDSGIAAVRVAVRNDGAVPLLIHSANGMNAGPGFEGFALAWNGKTYLPIHPKDVVARLIGARKAGRYRRHGPVGYVASTFFPPVAVYFIYNEADIGRFYRPLFNNSLYPALEDGMFEPVRIEPSQERSGYLYFAIPKEARGDSCELLVRACPPLETRYSLRGSDFLFSRDELPLSEPPAQGGELTKPPNSCDAPYGFLFALAGDAPGGSQALYLSRVRTLNPESDSLWTFLASVSSKSASIADASCIGSLAACAVNFKSKSKVYLMQCAGEPDVFEEHYFPRGIRRVFLHSGGAFVITEDGVCHQYDGGSHTWRRGVKLGIDVEDVAFAHGLLLAFMKDGDLNVYGASPLARIERRSLQQRVRQVVGRLDGKLLLLRRGSATRVDTVSVFDVDARRELFSGALPGKVDIAASDGSSLLVQLEEGSLVRFVPGPLDAFDVTEAGYLPFEARTLKAAPRGFIAVGASGSFAVGSIDSVSPGGAVEVSVRVR